MEIKEFILKGGLISYPYKDNEESWVGEAKMHYFMNEVIVEVPTDGGFKNFSIEDIDKSIDFYFSLITDNKNMCYKK